MARKTVIRIQAELDSNISPQLPSPTEIISIMDQIGASLEYYSTHTLMEPDEGSGAREFKTCGVCLQPIFKDELNPQDDFWFHVNSPSPPHLATPRQRSRPTASDPHGLRPQPSDDNIQQRPTAICGYPDCGVIIELQPSPVEFVEGLWRHVDDFDTDYDHGAQPAPNSVNWMPPLSATPDPIVTPDSESETCRIKDCGRPIYYDADDAKWYHSVQPTRGLDHEAVPK